MAGNPTTRSLEDLLLWAREHRFRVREIEAGGVRVLLDDLAIDVPGAVEKLPRTVHEAFAQQFGIATPADDEDEPS